MNSREVMYALNCCSPISTADKNCYACPFKANTNCHSALCESAIACIMSEHATVERYATEVSRISSELSNLSIK